MARPKHEEERIAVYRLYKGVETGLPPFKTAAGIHRHLKATGIVIDGERVKLDVPESTIRDWIRKWPQPLDFDPDAPFDFFHPEAAEVSSEALPILLDVIRARLDPIIERGEWRRADKELAAAEVSRGSRSRKESTDLDEDEAESGWVNTRPLTPLTVRQARRIWWLYNAVRHDNEPMPTRTLYYLAVYLASAEMASYVLGRSDEDVRRQVTGVLMYRAWVSGRRAAYRDAVRRKEFPSCPLFEGMMQSVIETERAVTAVRQAKGGKSDGCGSSEVKL